MSEETINKPSEEEQEQEKERKYASLASRAVYNSDKYKEPVKNPSSSSNSNNLYIDYSNPKACLEKLKKGEGAWKTVLKTYFQDLALPDKEARRTAKKIVRINNFEETKTNVKKAEDYIVKAWNSFAGMIIKSEVEKKYMIVYRGTNDALDWVINNPCFAVRVVLPQVKKAVRLYEQAKMLVEDANGKLKNGEQKYSIILTGHSLGGGLATIIGALTGEKTYTFNAAGASRITSRTHTMAKLRMKCINTNSLSQQNEKADKQETFEEALEKIKEFANRNFDNIHNYYLEGEVLQQLRHLIGKKNGNLYIIPMGYKFSVKAHIEYDMLTEGKAVALEEWNKTSKEEKNKLRLENQKLKAEIAAKKLDEFARRINASYEKIMNTDPFGGHNKSAMANTTEETSNRKTIVIDHEPEVKTNITFKNVTFNKRKLTDKEFEKLARGIAKGIEKEAKNRRLPA